jgi:hypothetical protein
MNNNSIGVIISGFKRSDLIYRSNIKDLYENPDLVHLRNSKYKK